MIDLPVEHKNMFHVDCDSVTYHQYYRQLFDRYPKNVDNLMRSENHNNSPIYQEVLLENNCLQ